MAFTVPIVAVPSEATTSSVVCAARICVCTVWHKFANALMPEGLKQTATSAGLWGTAVYIAIIALAVVVSPILGAPLAIAAGAIWGAVAAGICSVIGEFTGGLIAYFIGHTLGRSAVKALILILLPWGIRRYNWFGLRDIVHIE